MHKTSTIDSNLLPSPLYASLIQDYYDSPVSQVIKQIRKKAKIERIEPLKSETIYLVKEATQYVNSKLRIETLNIKFADNVIGNN